MKKITFLTFTIQLIILYYVTSNKYSNVSEFENYYKLYEIPVGNTEINDLVLKQKNFQRISYGPARDERPFRDKLSVKPLIGCDVPEDEAEGAIVLHDKIELNNYVSLDHNPEIAYMDSEITVQLQDIKIQQFLKNLNEKHMYQNFSKSFYLTVDKFSKEIEESRLLARELENAFQVTYNCRKKVKFGGIYRTRMPDGEKYVCLDPEVRINRHNCLVYSFGIGNDFSFEREAGLFGCDVYAFDDDDLHEGYPVDPFYRVNFFNQRLGTHLNGLLELLPQHPGKAYPIIYNSLANIMELLDHKGAILDYLKIDIEDAEWAVFENSLFKSGVLSRTRFLGVETHFNEIQNLTKIENPEHLRKTLSKYNRFFTTLRGLGFRVMHSEPNFYLPKFARVFGHVLSVYAETVWVNAAVPWVSAPRTPPARPLYAKAQLLNEPAQF